MKWSALPQYAASYLSSGPSYLVFYVTNRCNMGCDFCLYAERLNRGDESLLTLEQVEKLADSLRHCVQVTFTGGEPLLRPDLAELMTAFVVRAGARNVTVATNGRLTERLVEVMATVCRRHPDAEFRVSLSLDGLAERHDAVRHHPGAFASAQRSLRELRRLQKTHVNLHVLLSTVVSKFNEDCLEDFIDYAVAHLPFDDMTLVPVRGRTRLPDAKEFSAQRYCELVEYLRTRPGAAASRGHGRLLASIERSILRVVAATLRTGKSQIPCVAGGKLVVVSETGEVHPCEMLDALPGAQAARTRFGGSFRMGDLREMGFDLRRLLASPRARDIRAAITELRCFCTFECAIAASLVFNPRTLLRELRAGARGFPARSR